MKYSYVYIMSNKFIGVLYVGVTARLSERVYKHKEGTGSSFTSKYKLKNLVYYECFEDIDSAISREKQLKNWKRSWKIELIESTNKNWQDLYQDIL